MFLYKLVSYKGRRVYMASYPCCIKKCGTPAARQTGRRPTFVTKLVGDVSSTRLWSWKILVVRQTAPCDPYLHNPSTDLAHIRTRNLYWKELLACKISGRSDQRCSRHRRTKANLFPKILRAHFARSTSPYLSTRWNEIY